MATFRFLTQLRTTASPEQVHDVMLRPEDWSERWGDVLRIERSADGDAHGAGTRMTAAVRAPAGYTISAEVTVVEARRGERIVAELRGDLDGHGAWTFGEVDGATTAELHMTARTTRRWMSAAALLARPVLEWSHGVVMRHAAEAATSHLGVQLLTFDSRPLHG